MYSRVESGGNPLVMGLYLIVIVIMIVSWWKLFTKAGEPGWYSIIPIVNTITYAGIGGVSCLLLLLLFVPLVNIVVLYYVHYKVAEAFGQGGGFAFGMWLLPFIFIPILAFGDFEYQGGSNDWEKSKRKNDDDSDNVHWR